MEWILLRFTINKYNHTPDPVGHSLQWSKKQTSLTSIGSMHAYMPSSRCIMHNSINWQHVYWLIIILFNTNLFIYRGPVSQQHVFWHSVRELIGMILCQSCKYKSAIAVIVIVIYIKIYIIIVTLWSYSIYTQLMDPSIQLNSPCTLSDSVHRDAVHWMFMPSEMPLPYVYHYEIWCHTVHKG